ncbi:MAG: peptidoglycan bridge formation glycyltransferase FemA/FemB family protein [Candidatus Levybacteria bacterium]|nr:peptidoglycan bridge formation glycyltransferase FemA/FemB family protein [Candidatus Levybacteria bacterium]
MNTNNLSVHPLQSVEWGEFRKKTGVKVIRENDLLITIHKIPHTPFTIGYIPKGPLPTKEMLSKLKEIGKIEKCIFIQLEPNVQRTQNYELNSQFAIRNSFHPLFTKYTFVLDLTKSEDELLKNMHPKTRYNIKVAQKHKVIVVEDNSDEAFETYLKLTQETTKRQGFYAHTENYHRLHWSSFPHKIINHKSLIINQLSSHLLLANYQGKTLVAWIVFVYKDTLYYPYGASSTEHRETMASNLMMWETIRFGKKLGLKKLDMWGALGPNPDPKDPWYGFHRFKQGYGGELVEFVGSYDLVIDPFFYEIYKIVDKLRWFLLKMKNSIR